MAAGHTYYDHSLNWIIIQPTDLGNEETTSKNYDIFDKSEGSLFGGPVGSCANALHFMVELFKDKHMYEHYKHQMPVIKHKLPPEEKEL
eukprot:8144912-Ditylum_brightwellii.AAC.1